MFLDFIPCLKFCLLQACFSLAILSPAYEPNPSLYPSYHLVLTDTLGDDGTVNHNQTVKVYYGKMAWTGELFLLAGKEILLKLSFSQ